MNRAPGPSSFRGRPARRGRGGSSSRGGLAQRGRGGSSSRGGLAQRGRGGSSSRGGLAQRGRGDSSSGWRNYDRSLPKRQGPYGILDFPDGQGQVAFFKKWMNTVDADRFFRDVNNAKSFRRTCVEIGGNEFVQPRDTAYFGTRLYAYSKDQRLTGWKDDPPASTALNLLRLEIESFCGLPEGFFNVVLVNRYNHGRDSISWHADNEKSLGPEPIIASLSLGATRRFLVRPTKNNNVNDPHILEYELTHGSLIVMSGKMQEYYQHAVPKVSKNESNDIRINLTFRRVVSEY